MTENEVSEATEAGTLEERSVCVPLYIKGTLKCLLNLDACSSHTWKHLRGTLGDGGC